jgi:hypothetical protein
MEFQAWTRLGRDLWLVEWILQTVLSKHSCRIGWTLLTTVNIVQDKGEWWLLMLLCDLLKVHWGGQWNQQQFERTSSTRPCLVFCPCQSALVGLVHHSAKKPPLSLESFESDHELMQNGIIWLKKCKHSSNPGHNPACSRKIQNFTSKYLQSLQFLILSWLGLPFHTASRCSSPIQISKINLPRLFSYLESCRQQFCTRRAPMCTWLVFQCWQTHNFAFSEQSFLIV